MKLCIIPGLNYEKARYLELVLVVLLTPLEWAIQLEPLNSVHFVESSNVLRDVQRHESRVHVWQRLYIAYLDDCARLSQKLT